MKFWDILSNALSRLSHETTAQYKAGEEIARKETKVPKCSSGNFEKWKLRHRNVGVESAEKGNNGIILQGWKMRHRPL